jgi:hypothetical protein
MATSPKKKTPVKKAAQKTAKKTPKAEAPPARKRSAAFRKTTTTPRPAPVPAVSPEERHRRVAEAAYFIALKKGLGQSDPALDWAEAEKEVDGQLAREIRR